MKVKLGQWIRLDWGKIYQPSETEIDKEIWEVTKGLFCDRYTCLITKVANTPQELIQKGDLVATELYPLLPVTEVLNDLHINCYCEKFIRKHSGTDITEIWTKTSEDTYTRQWIDK